jgi:hypothetical protein
MGVDSIIRLARGTNFHVRISGQQPWAARTSLESVPPAGPNATARHVMNSVTPLQSHRPRSVHKLAVSCNASDMDAAPLACRPALPPTAATKRAAELYRDRLRPGTRLSHSYHLLTEPLELRALNSTRRIPPTLLPALIAVRKQHNLRWRSLQCHA